MLVLLVLARLRHDICSEETCVVQPNGRKKNLEFPNRKVSIRKKEKKKKDNPARCL